MKREELIEEAAKAVGEAAWGVYWLAIPAAFRERFVHDAEIAWAVFEKAQAPTEQPIDKMPEVHPDAWLDFNKHRFAQAPTDDERESYLQPALYNKLMAHLLTESGRDGLLLANEVRNATGASKLHRPAQTEPTDAQVERAARSIAEWNTSDVPLELCRSVARYALRAALAAGQEEQS